MKIDNDPPHAAIAVAKGMDGLEIQMKSGNFIQEVGVEAAGILDEDIIYHALYMLGCRRNMSAYPHVLSLLAKAPCNGIVNAADKHLMQEVASGLCSVRYL